jgi:hypothetical protein
MLWHALFVCTFGLTMGPCPNPGSTEASSSSTPLAGQPCWAALLGSTSSSSSTLVGQPCGHEVTQAEDATWISLRCDVFSGRHVLTHSITSEQCTLEVGDWSLHDLDGYCGLIDASIADEELQGSWATDHMKQSIYIQEGIAGPTEVIVQNSGPDGGHQRGQQLASALAEVQWCSITWPIGRMNNKFKHHVAQFLLPRKGARWWWRLQDIHINLGIKSCLSKLSPHSRWVSKRMQSWQKWVVQHGLTGSVMRGVAKGAHDNTENPAEWPTCSTHAFIAILSRCAFLNPRLGGLNEEEEREGAAVYLQTLVQAACGSTWSLDVFCAEGGLAFEPPEVLYGGMPRSFPVDEVGVVDCSACWSPLAPPLARALAKAVDAQQYGGQGHLHVEKKLDLSQVLKICMGSCMPNHGSCKQLSGLFTQLCIRIGERVEAVLTARGEPAMAAGSHGILRGTNLDMAESTSGEVDRAQIYKTIGYWKATQEVAAIHIGEPISFTLDATMVGRRSIQDCAVVWSTNVAAWLFPQAFRLPGNVY